MRMDAKTESRELQTDNKQTSLVTEMQLCTTVCSESIFQSPEGSGGRASRHVHLSVIYEVWQGRVMGPLGEGVVSLQQVLIKEEQMERG